MALQAKDQVLHTGTPAPSQTRNPFLWLDTEEASLEAAKTAVDQGLPSLRQATQDQIAALTNATVNYTFTLQQRDELRPLHQQISMSVLNRRRRAARQWIVTLTTGDLRRDTFRSLIRSWIPQLTGTGPDVHQAMVFAESLFEFVRGAISGTIMDEPNANLVPQAKALHALESMLSLQLRVLRRYAAAGV